MMLAVKLVGRNTNSSRLAGGGRNNGLSAFYIVTFQCLHLCVASTLFGVVFLRCINTNGAPASEAPHRIPLDDAFFGGTVKLPGCFCSKIKKTMENCWTCCHFRFSRCNDCFRMFLKKNIENLHGLKMSFLHIKHPCLSSLIHFVVDQATGSVQLIQTTNQKGRGGKQSKRVDHGQLGVLWVSLLACHFGVEASWRSLKNSRFSIRCYDLFDLSDLENPVSEELQAIWASNQWVTP